MHFRWTIGAKLLVSSTVALALTIAISVAGLLSITTLGAHFRTTIHGSVRKEVLAEDMQMQLATVLSLERGMRLGAFEKNLDQIESLHVRSSQSLEKVHQSIAAIIPLLVSAEGRTIMNDLPPLFASIAERDEQMYGLCKSHQLKQAAALESDTRPLIEQTSAKVARMIQLQGELMAGDEVAASEAVTASWWTLAGMLLLAVIAAACSVLVVHRMNLQLNRNVELLTNGADGVSSAALQVSASSHALAESASSQAASLEETSASSEEVHAVARRNMDSAKTTTDIVEKSQSRSVEANEQLQQMVLAMDEISQSSEKISKIIKVIDEIAFQTNILALNAAVEAARAGEAGLGFAVVADEVRSLAQRCAQAAKDTAGLIEESLQSANGGKQRVSLVADAVRALTGDSAGIRSLIDEISAGSEEQARGMKLIAGSLSRMEQATQGTAAAAEQGAAGAAEMNAESTRLKATVQQLDSMVRGGSAASATAPLPRHVPKPATRPPNPAKAAAPRIIAAPVKRVAIVTSVKVPAPASEAEDRFGSIRTTDARQSFPLEEDFKDF